MYRGLYPKLSIDRSQTHRSDEVHRISVQMSKGITVRAFLRPSGWVLRCTFSLSGILLTVRLSQSRIASELASRSLLQRPFPYGTRPDFPARQCTLSSPAMVLLYAS